MSLLYEINNLIHQFDEKIEIIVNNDPIKLHAMVETMLTISHAHIDRINKKYNFFNRQNLCNKKRKIQFIFFKLHKKKIINKENLKNVS